MPLPAKDIPLQPEHPVDGYLDARYPEAGAPLARGVFITFEGGEGSGKSTHIKFLAGALRDRGLEVVMLREPGGTKIGEIIRDVVLDPALTDMDARTELFLYEAARAQLVAEVIKPALERKAVVLCDRFFDSTVAYQSYGRGLDRDFVEAANLFASDGIVPDRTIVMGGASVKDGLARALHHSGFSDRLESAGDDFHGRVNAAFLRLVEQHPDRVRHIDSTNTKPVTAALIFTALSDIFPWMNDADTFSEQYFSALNTKGKKRTGADGAGGADR